MRQNESFYEYIPHVNGEVIRFQDTQMKTTGGSEPKSGGGEEDGFSPREESR